MLDKIKADYEAQQTPFTDNLTGLFNHGFFQMVFSNEINRSHRYQEPFSLVLIDINNFSIYNRQKGAIKGDRALRQIADLIREQIREVDLAARFSGDVFSVLLLRTQAGQGATVVERIRSAVNRYFEDTLTLSIGVASFPEDGTNKDDLFRRAQDALRQAKLKGKDSIHFFEQIKTSEQLDRPVILVVDDNPLNVKLLEGMLHPLNYNILKAYSGAEALTLINKGDIDVVLLDIIMPEMDGIEVCRRIKGQESTRMIPVIMVTALDESEAKVRAIDAGADDFLTKPPIKVELIARTRSLVSVKRLNENLIGFENTLISLANAVDAKDPYTEGHIRRVSSLALQLGKDMNLSGRELEALRIGGILHDIGKIGIPDAILRKESSFGPNELQVMQSHPLIGFKVVEPLKKNLQQALEIIRYHHEKLDGSGYPDGLRGEEISLLVRIMAVADIYDALITDRPYHRALSREKVLQLLKSEAKAGKLDGNVVGQLEIMINK